MFDLIQKEITPFITIIEKHKQNCNTSILNLKKMCSMTRNPQNVLGMQDINTIHRKSDLLVLGENYVDAFVSNLIDFLDENMRTCQQEIMDLVAAHNRILAGVENASNCVMRDRMESHLHAFLYSKSKEKIDLEHDLAIGELILSELKSLCL